jgi:hypothetical protein
LREGQSTLDLFGKEFVLLRLGAQAPSGDALTQAARQAQVPWRVEDIQNEEVERLYERRLVLVRPDGSVAWRGDEAPKDAKDAAALIDTVRGHHRVH